LPLLETARPNETETVDFISSLKPDLLVVAAFGALLKKTLLTLCSYPPLNVHPSLLPRHRGPAPVNWAIINGDEDTGVSVMFLEEGMDTGPVLAQSKCPIPPGLGAVALTEQLSHDGALLLSETIARLKNGTQGEPAVQNPQLATTNRLLEKKDGHIDFNQPAARLASLINGVEPWPGAQAFLNGKQVNFFGARALEGSAEPGEVKGLSDKGELQIGSKDGLLLIKDLQVAGKKRVAAAEFAKGYRPARFTSC
jgi:methionyl-tRNA formyltransferase